MITPPGLLTHSHSRELKTPAPSGGWYGFPREGYRSFTHTHTHSYIIISIIPLFSPTPARQTRLGLLHILIPLCTVPYPTRAPEETPWDHDQLAKKKKTMTDHFYYSHYNYGVFPPTPFSHLSQSLEHAKNKVRRS